MDGNDLPDWIEETFDFPVDRDTVVDRAGDIEIEEPGQTGSETLSTIIDRSGTETYQSQSDLLADIRGNLGEEYVGRKHYDDRSSTPDRDSEGTNETADESF